MRNIKFTAEQVAEIKKHKIYTEVQRLVGVLGLNPDEAIEKAIKVNDRRHDGYMERINEYRARDEQSRQSAGSTMLFC